MQNNCDPCKKNKDTVSSGNNSEAVSIHVVESKKIMLESVASNLNTLKIESRKPGKAGDKRILRLVLDANESSLLALIQVLKVFDEATR